MGVDVHFFTDINNGPEETMKALNTIGAENITFLPPDYYAPEYSRISFSYKDENRMISFHGNSGAGYIGLPSHMLSLSAWGSAVEILEKLASMFGGVLDRNDCNTGNAELFQIPGHGSMRWMMEQYYAKNENTPSNYEEDLANFIKYCEKRK